MHHRLAPCQKPAARFMTRFYPTLYRHSHTHTPRIKHIRRLQRRKKITRLNGERSFPPTFSSFRKRSKSRITIITTTRIKTVFSLFLKNIVFLLLTFVRWRTWRRVRSRCGHHHHRRMSFHDGGTNDQEQTASSSMNQFEWRFDCIFRPLHWCASYNNRRYASICFLFFGMS